VQDRRGVVGWGLRDGYLQVMLCHTALLLSSTIALSLSEHSQSLTNTPPPPP